VSAAHQCRLVESAGRAHHRPEAVVLDFVNPEFFAAFFFSALRFLVRCRVTSAAAVACEGAFQQTLETALILAFPNAIFLFHRPTPLSRNYCATRFVTIIRVGRKDRTVPLGLAKKRSRAGHRTTHTGCRIGAQAMRRRWLSKMASGSTCHARCIRGTEHGDERFATALLSDQHADALQKRVATA
jgi:hypothetical protein